MYMYSHVYTIHTSSLVLSIFFSFSADKSFILSLLYIRYVGCVCVCGCCCVVCVCVCVCCVCVCVVCVCVLT